jgi:hypothetical protein
MGHWCGITPHVTRKHPWVFANYYEFASDRDDNQQYSAFLFRDQDRTVFGIREFLGDSPHWDDLRQMATRVVTDDTFRKSLLSDRADLPKMWKKH